jgi:hypothetical protein
VRSPRTTVMVIETSSAIIIIVERITNKVLVIRIAFYVLRHGDAEDVKCDLSD